MSSYKLTAIGVQRVEDGAFIPNDQGNADWLAYQAWLSAGNVPLPMSAAVPPADYSNLDNLDKTLKAIGLLLRDYCNQLKTGAFSGSGAGGTKTIAEIKADFAAKYNAL